MPARSSGVLWMSAGPILHLAEPNLHAELGGIVNIEILIEFFCEIRDRGQLEAEFISNDRFGFAQSEMNTDFYLGGRGAAVSQYARGMGDRVFAQFDGHRDKTVLRVPCDIRGNCVRRDEPIGVKREDPVGG